jgi:hypothetical protein
MTARLNSSNHRSAEILVELPEELWPALLGVPQTNRLAIGLRRMSVLLSILRCMEQGASLNRAARDCGVAVACAHRLLAAWRRDGLAGLVAQTHRRGRPRRSATAPIVQKPRVPVVISARGFRLSKSRVECEVTARIGRKSLAQRQSEKSLRALRRNVPAIWLAGLLSKEAA